MVSARDRDGSVLLLARRGADVVVLSLLEAWRGGRRRGLCSCWSVEAVSFEFRGSALDLDRRCLEGEWLRLHDLTSVLHAIGFAVLGRGLRVDVLRVAWWRLPAAGARREGSKAGGVGGGLRSKLGKIEV